MLKEYLKHSRTFMSVFGPLIRAVMKAKSSDSVAFQRYRTTVLGGTLIVGPKNIPGAFEVSARSDVARRVVVSGYYEPDVTAVLAKLKLKEGIIVNIGANVGFYSIYFARVFPAVARILAVEPNPEAFQQLTGNISRNDLSDRIQAVQACIGESVGKIGLSIIEGMPEYSSIGGIGHPGVADFRRTSIEVPVLPLGSLVGDQRVSMIFVDTEGAEAGVFGGAKDILLRDKPLLFFECSDILLRKFGASTRLLEEKLLGFGYVVRNGLSRRLALQHPFEGEGIAIHQDDLNSHTM